MAADTDEGKSEVGQVKREGYPVLRWPGEPNRPTQPGLHFLRDTDSQDPDDVFAAEVPDPPVKDGTVYFFLLGHSDVRRIELPSKYEWVHIPDPLESTG